MKSRTLLSIMSIMVVLLAACSSQPDYPAPDSVSPAADELLTPPRQDWLTNGGTVYNQRWSPLDQVNRDNVHQLKGVWRTHLEGSGMESRHSGEAQPLVKDGVIYTVTGANDVFALSVESGEILWQFRSDLPADLGKSICCGWTSRGVGLGEGLVFLGRLDGKLLALDQQTGAVAWEVQAMPWQEGYSITAAPLYYDGMVITGFSGAEYGIRGQVHAYDATTGELLWIFHTIPGPGQFGHESWPADTRAWQFGGGSVWQTPAVDPELGLVYFSTGNPGPDYNGALREGDNLFTDSILALDVYSGDYRWHYQQVHHDIWDYDATNPVILFDLEYGGDLRKGIAQAGKTGWVYILDRITGEPLVGITERPVSQEPAQATAATQPYPEGDSFVPQFVDMVPEGVASVQRGDIFTPFSNQQPALVQPSPAGSANWPPSAYDPSRGVMYICAQESAMVLSSDQDQQVPEYHEGDLYIGGSFTRVNRRLTGVVAAMDLRTNTLVWQYRWPNTCYSGFVASAGNLLFVGRNDGRLTALDIDTGLQLWEFQTGAGMNTTVSIFEYDEQQYILAYSAGNLFAGSAHGDSLWLFALDGQLQPTSPADTPLVPR